MTEKYYIGFDEVSYAEFGVAREQAEQDGTTIASSDRSGKFPEYTLANGTVIRGDDRGGFNRIENGEKKEAWSVATINEWVQGESAGTGKAIFFIPAAK